MKQLRSMGFRLLGGLVGLVSGAMIGFLLLALVMIFTRSDLGLNNVGPGAIVGGGIGFVIGFRFPLNTLRDFLKGFLIP